MIDHSGNALFIRGVSDKVRSGQSKWSKLAAICPPSGASCYAAFSFWAGYAKLMNPGQTAQYFASDGIPAPGLMVWVAVIVEMIGGLAILVGFKTRWAAGILAIWSLITGVAVHLAAGMHSADAMVAYDNMIHFYKNLVSGQVQPSPADDLEIGEVGLPEVMGAVVLSLTACSAGCFAGPDFCLIFAPSKATMSLKSFPVQLTRSVSRSLTADTTHQLLLLTATSSAPLGVTTAARKA